MRAKILRLGFDLRAKRMISDEKKKEEEPRNSHYSLFGPCEPVSEEVDSGVSLANQ